MWTTLLHEELGHAPPPFGFANSPIVVGNVILVQLGGPLVGVAKETGDVLWTTGEPYPGYQTPLAVELAGLPQVVTIDPVLVGLDAATGESHWRLRHLASARVPGRLTVPLSLGDDRLLLPGYDEAAAIRLRRSYLGGIEMESFFRGYDVDWLGRTPGLEGTTSTPVLHEGFLYGFDREFLACLSAEDGQRAWKSREPGGQGLILVDGHLVLGGKGGTVVVVDASPDGYQERGRVQVLTETAYTYPTFSDGHVFVRDTVEAAAVKVSGGRPRLVPREP